MLKALKKKKPDIGKEIRIGNNFILYNPETIKMFH